MRVSIDANFEVHGLFRPTELELEGSRITLRGLLEELSQRSGGEIRFIEDGDVDPQEFLILLNGRPYRSLPQGLETEIGDGDRVTIIRFLEPLGGG